MSLDENVKTKARFLRNAAPQQFTDFFDALGKYSDGVAALMVMADDNLQLYQGRAQQCVKIMAILEEAKNGQ